MAPSPSTAKTDASFSSYIFERDEGGLASWGQVAKLTGHPLVAVFEARHSPTLGR